MYKELDLDFEVSDNAFKHYSIYCLAFPTGQYYIGATSRKPKERWRNGEGYKNNKHIYDVIKTVGWNNIQKLILATDLIYEQATFAEKYVIEKLQAEGVPLLNVLAESKGLDKGKEESKQATLNRQISLSLGKQVQDMLTNNKQNRSKRKVRCLDTGMIFNSITEAYEITGIDKTSISHACSGKVSVAGGYSWEYIDKQKATTTKKSGYAPKPVICVETGRTYSSAYEAVSDFIPNEKEKKKSDRAKQIREVCKHLPHHITVFGLHWEYA